MEMEVEEKQDDDVKMIMEDMMKRSKLKCKQQLKKKSIKLWKWRKKMMKVRKMIYKLNQKVQKK